MKLSKLLAYSVLIFIMMAGFGLTHFYPHNTAKTEQKALWTPIQFIANIVDAENNSQSASNSVVAPKNSPQNNNPFISATNSESSPTQINESSPAQINESQTLGSGITSPNPELRIYENNPAKEKPRPLQVIDWSAEGPIIPGKSLNSSTVYLRNEGAIPIGIALSTANWALKNLTGSLLSADYQRYFTITWNYNNYTILANQVIPVIFTLAIATNITDVATFSFDIIVMAY